MMCERIVRILDKALSVILVLSGLLFMLISAYSLYDNHQIYSAANDDSLLVYKPKLGISVDQVEYISDKQVGWLQVYDTNIDFPLMQGESNFEFLSIDPYGEYRMSGSIFLDFRNDRNFQDDYSVIYGHHMERDTMFGQLDSFTDQSYFEAHRWGRIVTREDSLNLELFAVAIGEGTDWTLFDPIDRTIKEIKTYLKDNALIYSEYNSGDRIVALTTCWGDYATKRLLVFGMLSTQEMGE